MSFIAEFKRLVKVQLPSDGQTWRPDEASDDILETNICSGLVYAGIFDYLEENNFQFESELNYMSEIVGCLKDAEVMEVHLLDNNEASLAAEIIQMAGIEKLVGYLSEMYGNDRAPVPNFVEKGIHHFIQLCGVISEDQLLLYTLF